MDYTNLGSVMHHQHRGLSEPWGIDGVKISDAVSDEDAERNKRIEAAKTDLRA